MCGRNLYLKRKKSFTACVPANIKIYICKYPVHNSKVMDFCLLEGSKVEQERSQGLFLKAINFFNTGDKNSGGVEGHSCYVGAATWCVENRQFTIPLSP